MENLLKPAVMLSIITSPVKLGISNLLNGNPCDILKRLEHEKLVTPDFISAKYSRDLSVCAEQIIDTCIRQRVNIVTIWDDSYPVLLKEIHNPPVVLYVAGEFVKKVMISIVGTRSSDQRSEYIAARISGAAVQSGYTVVSGMAAGIDRAAHLGALDSSGDTVAVMPGGVDMIYPSKNIDLYRRITESQGSAIISELPPGTAITQKWTFVRRNRIISGLSEALVVVQAPLKSGAMITAGYALEQNRRLLACPGNAFDDRYSGCNELIKQGAEILSDITDLFPDRLFPLNEQVLINPEVSADLSAGKRKGIILNRNEIPEDLTGDIEKTLFKELQNGAVEVDEFIRKHRFTAEEVNRGITILEISGYLERRGGRILKI